MNHCNEGVVLHHVLLSEQVVNCVKVYKLQLIIKNNGKHDIGHFSVKENLLAESSLLLKSVSIFPHNSGLTAVDPVGQPLLVKEGFLVDPAHSTLYSCSSVVITYELMTQKSGCNYKQLSSLVAIGRKRKIFEVSSLVIDVNVCCEPVCTTVVTTSGTTTIATSNPVHECEDFTTVIPALQGGEVILNAFIKNQNPTNDPNVKCQLFGIPGSSIYFWDQILQNAINANRVQMNHISNEIAGAYAAQNFSDVKEGGQKVGVVFTTRGPAVMLAMSAIASAYREELPLIYICGVSPTDREDEFQNFDLKMLNSITKKQYRITKSMVCVNEVTAIIDDACYTAIHGTKENVGRGPVIIFVNFDFWRYPIGVSCCKDFVPKTILTGNETNALYDLVSRWNNPSVKAVVVRVGTRLYSENAQLIIEMAKEFPQLYVVTTADSRGLISPNVDTGSVKKYFDMQGPPGNAVANSATDYAAKNGLVIDLGVGILYTTLVTDVTASGTGSVLRLFDEPITFDGYYVNVNEFTQMLYNNKSKLNVGVTPSFNPCVPYNTASPNPLSPNAGLTYTSLPFGGDSTLAFKAILNTYLSQINLTGPLYPTPGPSLGCWVANCMTAFYNNDPNYVINDDYHFVTDSGTATFIAGNLLRNSIPDNDAIYTEFSAIGLGISSCSGKLWRKEKDAVLFIGEGASINLLSHYMDLKYAAIKNGKRALVLLFNDFKYGNVALGDLALFGTWTSITSTEDMMNTINIDSYFASLSPVQYITATLGNINSTIQNFRSNAVGWNVPGLYVIRMNGNTTKILTTNGIDYPIPA